MQSLRFIFTQHSLRGIGRVRRIALQLAVALVAVFLIRDLSAQNGPPRQQKKTAKQKQEKAPDELPKSALWRKGDYGKAKNFNGIYRLTFSPDGKLLVSRNQEMVVAVMDAKTNKTLCEIEGHEYVIQSVHFSPDSRYLITAAGFREKVKIWDVQTGKLVSTIDTKTSAAYFSPAGNRINILGEEHVETYSWPGTQLVRKVKWRTKNENRLGMSPNGRLVLMYRKLSDDVFQTLVMDTETRTKTPLKSPTSIPRAHAFSNDFNWVSVCYERDLKPRLWDLRDPHARSYELTGHDETAQSVSFSADNRFLISTSWDDSAILWDVLSQQSIKRYRGHTDNVNAGAFAPFGFQFASGASGRTDNSILLWEFTDQVQLPFKDNAEDFESIWQGLGHQDYPPAITDVSRIVASPDLWIKDISDKVTAETNANSGSTIDHLIKSLDSADFQIREDAVLQLIKVRVQADSQIRLALENTTSPEMKYRLARVLKHKIDRTKRDVVDERRWMRLIFALEQINSDESQSLLERIADGHRNIDYSQAAQSSFERNQDRSKVE